MARFEFSILFLLVAGLALAGCRQQADTVSKDANADGTASEGPGPGGNGPAGEDEPSEGVVGSSDAAPLKPAGFAKGELFPIGNYLIPLDEGRLEVAPPKDWDIASRSSKYLARFLFDRKRSLPLPRITVSGLDAAANEPRDVTGANVAAYCELVADGLEASTRQALMEEVTPLVLGDISCARYVVKKTFRQGEREIRGACETLLTIRDGRVYKVSLDVHRSDLVKYRSDVYTVMAHLKFPLAKVSAASESTSVEPETASPETASPESAAPETTTPAAESAKEQTD